MNWDKINVSAVMFFLRKFEKQSLTIDGEYAISYSDGKEEVKISYRRLEKKE